MKRMAMAAVVAAAVLALPEAAAAQLSDDATMTVSVNVIRGLTLTNVGGGLNFGTRAANTTATVLMADGIAFTASGQAGQALTVTFANAPLTIDGGTHTLTFVPAVGGSATSGGTYSTVTSGGPVNLNGDGAYFFRVGGSIDIPETAPGSYTGLFTLSVAYAGI